MVVSAENLVSLLTDTQLPALAVSKRQFQSMVDSPSTSHADLGRLAGQDPGIAVQLYRELANADHRPEQPVVSLTHIISLLGMDAFRSLLQRTPTLEERFLGPGQRGLKRAYGRALLASGFARRLATLRGKVQVEEDAATALLQNLGELILWARKPGTMSVLGETAARPEQRDVKALLRFGICPSETGEIIATRWALPQVIVRVQRFHNSFDSNSQLPLLAASLAWSCSRDWCSEETDELMDLAAEFTHLDADLIRAQLHREAARTARIAHELGLPHSADRLIQLPGPSPKLQTAPMPMPVKTKRPAVPATPIVRKPKAATGAIAKPAEPATAAAVAASVTPTTSATARAPRPAAKPAAPEAGRSGNTLQRHISAVLKQVRAEVPVERVLFAMLTPDKSRIRARFVMEREKSGLDRFSVDAQSRNLFALLMQKPRAIWVNRSNQDKFTPYMPETASEQIADSEFFVVTVVVKQKPIGMLYADDEGKPLSEDRFTRFKQLSLSLARGFEKP